MSESLVDRVGGGPGVSGAADHDTSPACRQTEPYHRPSYTPSRPKIANPQCFSTASTPAGRATVTQDSDSSDENGEVFRG
jgi:hypothetical protein